LPSLGHVSYAELLEAFQQQAEGLLAGGVDAFLIETCQDPLQIKAAVEGCKQARLAHTPIERQAGYTPIFVQVTVETTGTLLVGTDIGGVMTLLESLDVDALGMNCATGPKEMEEHVKQLAEGWERAIFLQPNAGLPSLKQGKTHYDLSAPEMRQWLAKFMDVYGLNLIGGCCGTNPSFIEALHGELCHRAEHHRGSHADQNQAPPVLAHRPRTKPRTVTVTPAVASLYGSVPLRQENAFFAMGERCNANGSKLFRESQAAEDWDTCLSIANEQVREGSHALDVCTAYVGRNEVQDMTTFLTAFRGSVNLPAVIDSTELPVIQAALELYGGKPIVNSINFEDGEAPAHARMKLVKQHGASVIALTIDEAGMAKTVEDKLRIAERLIQFTQEHYNLPIHDLMIDPLTFTICTGNEDDRPLGYWTLDAIEALSKTYPDLQIILGLSNISFGLNPTARKVLNSVYLHEAVQRGMTGAIVHVSKIMPLHRIDPEQRETALDLIYDRREKGDPLQRFLALFENVKASGSKKDPLAHLPTEIEDRLKQRIVDGVKIQLNEDLAKAMETYPPLEIINGILLEGMKVVGELFGSGQMQLPFVLQSAETMKTAVAYLEPFMEKAEGQEKGIVVLATVKGDVHDIGKNLVDIILTNNGYKVHNLGIKQVLDDILKAKDLHQAHALGLSGLLVKSTVIMRENLIAMQEQGLTIPVFLGGAALTRAYVEQDCYDCYPHVAYVKDAFESLAMMERIGNGTFDAYCAERYASYTAPVALADLPQALQEAAVAEAKQVAVAQLSLANVVPLVTEADTPRTLEAKHFVGESSARLLLPTVAEVLPYLNTKRLFTLAWGFEAPAEGETEADWESRLGLRGHLERILALPDVQATLQPHALVGALWATPEYPPNDHDREEARLYLASTPNSETFATWATPLAKPWGCDEQFPSGLTLAHCVHPQGEAVLGFAVTLGEDISALARGWFASDKYQDYLFLHGILGELVEATTAWLKQWTQTNVLRTFATNVQAHRYGAGGDLLPNLATQHELLQGLQANRLGLAWNAETQTVTHEEATTGLFILHDAFAPLAW
ncbi:MAG: homocysteine S-methyltransferase family protein, partial [Vampirovibrionales bacterium]